MPLFHAVASLLPLVFYAVYFLFLLLHLVCRRIRSEGNCLLFSRAPDMISILHVPPDTFMMFCGTCTCCWSMFAVPCRADGVENSGTDKVFVPKTFASIKDKEWAVSRCFRRCAVPIVRFREGGVGEPCSHVRPNRFSKFCFYSITLFVMNDGYEMYIYYYKECG